MERTGRYTFLIDGREVDFNAAMELPMARKISLATPFVLWGGEQKWLIKLLESKQREKVETLKKG